MGKPIRLGVLVSGGGTTLQNLLDRIDDGRLEAEVAVVVANKPNTLGEGRARDRGIPTAVVRPSEFDSVEAFSEVVSRELDRHEVDLVCLAGFLVLWRIPERYRGRVVNIHPALIPAFCGKGMYGHRVHEAVVASGVKVSGCTVHFADNQYDHGPIILQRTVPVGFDDTPDDVAERVFREECEAYPEAIRLFAAGRLRIDGGRVHVLPE